MFVELKGQRSKYRKVKIKVPQGGVSSAIEVSMLSYVDECTIILTGINIYDVCAKITDHLATINTFFQERNLQLSPTNSTYLFSLLLAVSVDG